MLQQDRSARYHISPKKSQRLFNLLARRKGAKDREIKPVVDQPVDAMPSIKEAWAKRASQDMAPQYDLAQQLTNAGLDPEEVRNLQYTDPTTALRMSQRAREWAQQGDQEQLGGLASANELQRKLLEEYQDKGWAQGREGWLGTPNMGGLERFLTNAWRGGSQTLDRESLAGAHGRMQRALTQQLIEQGMDPRQARLQAITQMPSEQEFAKQIADRQVEEGTGGGALNFAAPFLTGYALPAWAGWSALNAMKSDASRGLWGGDQEAQERADMRFEAAQRQRDAGGGASLWGDLWRVVKSPLSYAMGNVEGGTADLASGLSSLYTGGQDYTKSQRDLALQNMRRARDQWEAQNLTQQKGPTGLSTREGIMANMSRASNLQGSAMTRGLAQQLEADRTAPHRDLWGTADGFLPYLGIGKDQSDIQHATSDVMTGAPFSALSGGATNPFKAQYRNLRDMFTGRDTQSERLMEAAREGDPRLKNYAAIQEMGNKSQFDTDMLGQVDFGHRGGLENKPWYLPWGGNDYGERTGVPVDKLIGSQFWTNYKDQLARGTVGPAQHQQIQQFLAKTQQDNPEVHRLLTRDLYPAMNKYKTMGQQGMRSAAMQEYMDQRPQAQQPVQQSQQPQQQVVPQQPQAQHRPVAQQQVQQPQNIPKQAALWAKQAGPVGPEDMASHGPFPSTPEYGFTPTPVTRPGPHAYRSPEEIQGRIQNPVLPYQMGDRTAWTGARRNAAYQQYSQLPDVRRQYFQGREERWNRPQFIPGSFRGVLSEQDEWALDPVIQQHRQALLQGNWQPGMLIDQAVDRGTVGWTNPLGGAAGWAGFRADPEAEAEQMMQAVRGSGAWKHLRDQYRQGLISRQQFQNAAPASLDLLQSPEDAIRDTTASTQAGIRNRLREAMRLNDVQELKRRQDNPLRGL